MILLIALIGCTDGDDTAAEDICVDAPVVTWDNFGAGFTTENCQACHASTVPVEERNEAPEEVNFDSEADVAVWGDRMLTMATGEEPLMPPQGGVSDDDRYLLEVWLTCFPPEATAE
jgi:uncharacterized membrane protein